MVGAGAAAAGGGREWEEGERGERRVAGRGEKREEGRGETKMALRSSTTERALQLAQAAAGGRRGAADPEPDKV